jgi:ABC-2 type transport system ATP-binding protein
LKLTILLSSHFLSEVEQICTRIAVLNQGRMVFEGTLAETKEAEQWVRIKVGDFQMAVTELRKAALITAERGGQLVALAPNVETDQVVRLLVQKGISVFEITPAEETLESFYLRLMAKPEANDAR